MREFLTPFRGPLAAVFTLCLATGVAVGDAQTPATMPLPAVSQDEAARLATAWALLAQGKYLEAADQSESVLSQFPHSPAALALAVEAVIAGRGAHASLDTYERWLSGRTLEASGPLSRIARAVLYEWSRQRTDVTARADALKTLAADGVPEAIAALAAGAEAGGVAEGRALVALGDPNALDKALAKVKATPGLKLNEIRVLGESRSPRVVQPLLDLLVDERPQNRAEAATALGKVGQTTAVGSLKPLLSDSNGVVRLSAAGALLQLGDSTGIAMIRELAASEHSAVRRTAAALLASQPDDDWKALVRGLAADPDPSFRLDAARLLAPHDAEFSKSIFESLMLDQNPEIREQAGVLFALDLPPDVPALRRLLRAPSGRVRVAAAGRLMTALR